MDNNQLVQILVVPGTTALLLTFLFAYLYRQTADSFFKAWAWGWVAYLGYYLMLAYELKFKGGSPFSFGADLCFLLTGLCILASTRLTDDKFRWHWTYAVVAGAGVAWAAVTALQEAHHQNGLVHLGAISVPVRVEIGFSALLIYCAWAFLRIARERESQGYRILAISLCIWAFLVASREVPLLMVGQWAFFGFFLGPLPQLMQAISMVMIVYETQRRDIDENLETFSSLEADFRRILEPVELIPTLEKILRRLTTLLHTKRAAIYIFQPSILPSVQRRFSPNFLSKLDSAEASTALRALLDTARGNAGLLSVEFLSDFSPEQEDSALSLQTAARQRIRELLAAEGVSNATLLPLETRERTLGCLLLPHSGRRRFAASQTRLLMGMSLQLATVLEKYVLQHESQRRTREYELLTEIGQVISSHLDQNEVLHAIRRELGRLFDTANFYVAFLEDDLLKFELEVEDGVVQPKRNRQPTNGITEYVIRTARPLLITHDIEAARAQLGVVSTGRGARCFCGVPIFANGVAVGVMAVMNFEREYVYGERDLNILRTVAGQLAVARENARLFEQEQRRSRYLAFLNNISKTAISSQNAEEMLAEIVSEIQKNFNFDHIGIGILDYATKAIEIKAEAGATSNTLGRRIPLGVGILGRVARTGETALVQNTGESNLLGILPESLSVLCVPISYSETLLGVLNIESKRDHAFAQEEVLILRTLADVLATALHNAFVFQKMQQQYITDGLTGIKTRRYFLEALQSEWKRASRSGRPFSVVMVDLDKFKEVNDGMGHLEGDLVLARIGRLLEQKSRSSNVVARYGGDEFILLMPETSAEQARILSERIRLWIATDPFLNERHITGSFGVAAFPQHGSSAEDLIRIADSGMYISKKAGGNKVSVAEEINDDRVNIPQRSLLKTYIEGFLCRDEEGPGNAEDLIETLRKMAAAVKGENDAQALRDAVRMMNRAAEAREIHSAGHGKMVATYAQGVARELGFSGEELEDLVYAAQVHDVGKIVLPETLLNKAGPLTPEEYQMMKNHPSVGGDILAVIPHSERIQSWVRHHQERFDGTGYPAGLKGEQIPLGARIIAVAEAYADMTADRPYSYVKNPAEAMAEMESLSGTQFDGMLVRLLTHQLRGEKVTRPSNT